MSEFMEIIQAELFQQCIIQQYAADLVELIRAIVNKNPKCFSGYMLMLGDVILRAIDLAKDSSSEGLIEAISSLIRDMLGKYAHVAFHQATEYLAVGGEEGTIAVYALREHQKLKVLEGHEAAVSALAFDQEGEELLSYSAKENTMRIWELNAGFLSFIGVSNRSSIIYIDRYTQRTEAVYKSKRKDLYPQVDFNKENEEVILCLSSDEAYAFSI